MKRIFLSLAVAIVCLTTFAQNGNNELLKKLVEKQVLTQAEASEIEKSFEKEKKDDMSAFDKKIQKVSNVFNNKYMQLGGYGLITYTYNNTAHTKHKSAIRAVFLSMQGEVIEGLSYMVFFNLKDPSLTEYYVTYKPIDFIGFRIGQQKMPLSIENQMSVTEIEFIRNTRTVASLMGMGGDVLTLQNGKDNTGRDLGLQAFGSFMKLEDHNLFDYNIGIFEGTGLNTSSRTNNKDFVANLLVQPIKGVRIGGGVYFGEAEYSLDKNPLNKEKHVRNRWILSADYKSDRFSARAEYIRGKDSTIKKEGIYGLASWFFVPKKWNLVAKFDYYNNNKDFNTEAYDYSAGINYYIYKKCRVQANYTYSDYSKNWGTKDAHTVEAQLQIVF